MTDDPKVLEGWLLRNDWFDVPSPSPFPPITSDNILKQSRAEGWELRANNPIRWLRGRDHD